MTKLRDRAGDGSWLGDLAELLELLFPDGKISSGLRWGLLLMSAVAALVVGWLLFANFSSAPAPQATPTASSSESPSANPSAAPSPSETATPSLKESLFSLVPGDWSPSQEQGCVESWSSPTSGISSVLVMERTKQALQAAGFETQSAWAIDSMSVSGTGNEGAITSVELFFTTSSMSLCLR